MNEETKSKFREVWSQDRQSQYNAFEYLLDITEQPVDWAYEVWEECLAHLGHADNHNRAIAAQLLCNLAKSDPQERILRDFPALLAVTHDARFVTARHTLQALWKVGAAGEKQKQLFLKELSTRFRNCGAEKNCTLIRYDILKGFRDLYDLAADEKIRAKALALIETETDPKYRKKYTTLWKGDRTG
jgi:hypothetical protein